MRYVFSTGKTIRLSNIEIGRSSRSTKHVPDAIYKTVMNVNFSLG